MTLKVEPEAIRHYGFMLSRARDDARECKNYFSTHLPEVEPGLEGGFFNPIGYAHNGVRQELGKLLDHLVDILDVSHQALFAAAKHYEGTDADSAKRLDQTYAAVQRPIAGVS
ncbi:hypothetical protein [Actinoplanes sp. G11-F43]|uniref:hypothetical protein n=1 Tax=Actinoplanes sp. G11-F43 TaxID=3424130 RepID=UPI003D32B5D6